MAIFPLMRKDMAENDAASQAVFERQTKSYASENDLFPFSVFWIVAKKTSNTGAERLLGRDHLITDGVYPLCKPIEAHSMKIYGAAKAHPKFDKQHQSDAQVHSPRRIPRISVRGQSYFVSSIAALEWFS